MDLWKIITAKRDMGVWLANCQPTIFCDKRTLVLFRAAMNAVTVLNYDQARPIIAILALFARY